MFLLLVDTFIPNSIFADYKMADNVIYRNDKPFAQIKFLKIKGLDSDSTFTGIAIYYVDINKQIWICPKDGWRLVSAKNKTVYTDIDEINRLYNTEKTEYYLLRSHERLSKYEFITGVCLNYSVTDLKISVEQQGLFWNTAIKFDILSKEFL